ncbi:MAG: phage tail protein [Sphingomonadales bacterium]|jgi:phage protein U
MMLALGMFVFGLDTLPYQDFSRKQDWKHARLARVGARDASQFTGPGADTLQLKGYIVPEFAGPNLAGSDGTTTSLDQLRDMAASGQAFPLVDGNGRVLGAWVIDGIEEGQSIFFANGQPRRIDFTIDLHQVDG